jgi:hypothetical protein
MEKILPRTKPQKIVKKEKPKINYDSDDEDCTQMSLKLALLYIGQLSDIYRDKVNGILYNRNIHNFSLYLE